MRPVALRTAGGPGSPTSVVRHVGRASGRDVRHTCRGRGHRRRLRDRPALRVEHRLAAGTCWPAGRRPSCTTATDHDGPHARGRPADRDGGHFSTTDQRMHQIFRVDECLQVRQRSRDALTRRLRQVRYRCGGGDAPTARMSATRRGKQVGETVALGVGPAGRARSPARRASPPGCGPGRRAPAGVTTNARGPAVVGVGTAGHEPVVLEPLQRTAGHRQAQVHQLGELRHPDRAQVLDPAQQLPPRARQVDPAAVLPCLVQPAARRQAEQVGDRRLDRAHLGSEAGGTSGRGRGVGRATRPGIVVSARIAHRPRGTNGRRDQQHACPTW